MRKLIFGIGINDANYQVSKKEIAGGKLKDVWRCPYHRAWSGMMNRCYSTKYSIKYPSYFGCEVAPEWHRFSVFRAWMEGQDWQNNHLDKDILVQGNKIYCPDRCVFVSRALNNFLIDGGSSRSDNPMGARWNKRDKKFDAKCRNPFTGKQESLGYFSDAYSAHKAWRKRKHEIACQYADIQKDHIVACALRNRFA